MKHSRITLLEKAAELYDFEAALRRAPVEPVVPQPSGKSEAATPAQPEPAPAPRARAVTPLPPAGGIVAVNRVALAEAGFILPDAPVTGLAEEFRLIKRELLASLERRVSLPEEKRRSLLVTSAQSGDGKTFFAVNLALSLAAESEVELLLVDGDFAKPAALDLLGIEPGGAGFVDALADPSLDPERLVVATDIPGLSVLAAGRRVPNVPELLASERAREVLARLVAARPRRLVLFDSPPALMASPAALLSAQVGQVILVVRADRTTEADLRETVGILSGCDHLGLVLNGAALSDSGRNFGGYEGYRHAD